MRTIRPILIVLLVTLSVVGAGATPIAATSAGVAVPQEQTQQTQRIQGTQCSFPFTATDATGTEVTVEEKPERVTTLSPSAAQTMWDIGGKEQVVGLTQFALYLDGAESRTNVSAAGFGVDNEKVVGTEPDLVLAPNVVSNETVAKLRDAGLTVFRLEAATSIEDVAQKTTLMGKLTGNCEGAAKMNAWMNKNVEAAQQAVDGTENPKVIYPLGGGYVAADDTFIDSMMTAAGATNVAAQANLSGYPQISDERVVELAPEIVLVTSPAGAAILDSEPYASTPAGENNRTVMVDVNNLNQPAPRSVVFAVRNMTRGFHPDAYGQAQFVSKSEASASSRSTDSNDATTAETTSTDSTEMTETADGTAAGTPTVSTQTDTSTPGFDLATAIVALVALLAMTLLASRRR